MTVAEIDPEPIADWARKVGSKAQEAYVTAAEKIAQRERAKALVEGRVEGRLDGRRETLRQQLEQRFGPLSASFTQQIQMASEEQLKMWTSRVLDAQSVAQVFEV